MKKQDRSTAVVRHDVSLFTKHDIYLFKEGNHFNLYDKLGSHSMTDGGTDGTSSESQVYHKD